MMAKKSKHDGLDALLAKELGLELQTQTLPLKKVQTMVKEANGLYFAFVIDGYYYYDTVESWAGSLGCRVKPKRFLLEPRVRQRLEQRHYLRWYFHYGTALYRVQIAKPKDLFDRLWFQPCDDNPRSTNVLIEVESMFLRKKPLMQLRESKLPWYDIPDHWEPEEMKKRA